MAASRANVCGVVWCCGGSARRHAEMPGAGWSVPGQVCASLRFGGCLGCLGGGGVRPYATRKWVKGSSYPRRCLTLRPEHGNGEILWEFKAEGLPLTWRPCPACGLRVSGHSGRVGIHLVPRRRRSLRGLVAAFMASDGQACFREGPGPSRCQSPPPR